MLPVYVASRRHDGQTYRFLVNGRTGRTTGDAPYSATRIVVAASAVALGLVAVVGAVAFLAFG